MVSVGHPRARRFSALIVRGCVVAGLTSSCTSAIETATTDGPGITAEGRSTPTVSFEPIEPGEQIAAPSNESGSSGPLTSDRNEPPPGASQHPATAVVAELDRVVDGDSIWLLVDGVPVEGRLDGINAPESDECGGPEASAVLAAGVRGRDLWVTGSETDNYGRRLVRLWAAVPGDPASEIELSTALVATGWALAGYGRTELVDPMSAAADQGLGWWTLACGAPAPTSVGFGELHVDADGDDRNNLNDEWVELVNSNDTDVGLDGWVLRDDTTGHRFPLDGRVIAARGSLRIRTGCNDTGRVTSDMFLCEDLPVWSNAAETALLLEPSGTIADYRILI